MPFAPYPYLPELAFTSSRVVGDEIYLHPQRRLAEVLVQRNPVYLVLDTPGLKTKMLICFPKTGVVRLHYGQSDLMESFLGETSGDQSDGQTVSWPDQYRFGMRLNPWLYVAWLSSEHCSRYGLDNILNYPVQNCISGGHSGVLVRVFRPEANGEKYRGWMEIHFFSTGNEDVFDNGWQTHPKTKLLARFQPVGYGTTELRWEPEQLLVSA